jgi:hypothetical protein
VGAGVADGRPFRLAFLLHFDADIAPASAYRQAIDLFVAADPALPGVTDLLVSFVPGVPEFDEHVRLLTATAREMAPPLGRRPLQER